MTDLSLEGVSKLYGATTALDDVTLSIRDGEFFTLVGPSGCGKTTTLRTVAGFEAPTEGTVRFGDRDAAGLPPEDRDVGVVFQQYALFPHMTVAENVGYGLRFSDVGDPDRVDRLLDLVGLSGFGDREPAELSGGQQQRVALARALAPEPDLLLLDEPLSALDARLRQQLRRDVRRIQQDLGVTTLYVTHDQAEALAVSDRVAVMNGGRVEQVGTPQAVYREPATRFVAEFVGENNLFDATRVDGGSGAGTAPASPRDDDAGPAEGGGPGGDAVETGGSTAAVDGVEFRLPPFEGDSVTFCVRPAALDRDADRNRITATVDYAEFLGDGVRVGLEWRGRELVWRTDAEPDGDEVTVGFDPADAVLL